MNQLEKKYVAAPTIEQLQSDAITQLSIQYWAPFGNVPKLPYNAEIIERVYHEELLKTNFLTKRIMVLEFGQYLENYLWPNYTENASKAHVMSIIAIINEKCREKVQVWECFEARPDNFSAFFHQSMDMSLDESLTFHELCVVITFFINAFNNLGNELVRNEVAKVCTLLMWTKILPSKRQQIFSEFPRYKKAFQKMKKSLELNPKKSNKKEEEEDDEGKMEKRKKEVETKVKEVEFLPRHIERFLSVLEGIKSEGPIDESCVSYCERFLEWMIDVQSQLFTRKFFTIVLDSYHVVVKCRMSGLVKREKEGHLFGQLLDMLQFYCRFEIDDMTGNALDDKDMMTNHFNKILKCQKVAFQKFPELRKFALSHIGGVDERKSLMLHFGDLPNKKLHEFASQLNLVPEPDDSKPEEFSSEYLLEMMIYHLEARQGQLEMLNEMPLYPTEKIIWDENVVPMQYQGGSGSKQAASGGLALPKLNLLFLTVHDYLLRNFNLFRLESTYEIRQDIEDAIYRLKPYLGNDGSCSFGGWARMAHPIESFNVVEVAKPNVGKKHPSRVRANLTVNLRLRPEIKREWESLRKHDIVFLITLRPHNPTGSHFDYKAPFIPQVGLTYVRGCEIEGMLDDNGKMIEEGMDSKPALTGNTRTFRVILDPNQYQQDLNSMNEGAEDPYMTFNVVMRRKPKENNFKAVLETIRDLMNTKCVIPPWLHEKILGYKEKEDIRPEYLTSLDFNDTFLNMQHLRSCFPDHKVVLKKFMSENESKKPRRDVDEKEEEDNAIPPYKLTFNEDEQTIAVEPYVHINRGPYPVDQPKRNQVPFTKTQVEAVRSGMQPGLTMVVGPPGTGKTDVAVQIISNLYHNFPDQRTLIVTHSNQALNQLFEKIMCLDIEERHLLRLGHGEEELETDKDYSRYGRVNYVLSKRLELLEKVQRLQASLDIPVYQEHTCETAEFFYIQVLAKWQEFQVKLKKLGQVVSAEEVSNHFPFHKFFEDAPQPIFKKNSFEEDMEIAEGCYRYIEKIFSQLEEFRPFELLRNGRDRVKYLLIKEAKIIAMTCTHAALKRRDLVEAGFQYDNILMEEAAQILEIETFIPLLLQNPQHGQNRLKRWIMIGDHHQLPPVIKNMAFQKFSNMEQSLFTRFVNIGYNTVDLDAQGRSRPSICKLFSWRYKNLGNLPHLTQQPEYLRANPGFFFDYQLIDVQDFNGVGESEPNPFFYQNLAEAEYICGVYTYLRLIGYPSDKICILTTYNGQKHLIRDVIQQRCASNKLIGKPSKITTVDRYQGQQNDIILLSLVRTKNVGHLRDVRRLVVAMSRARLGLYIFARVSLFKNCLELRPAFSQLMSRPLQLHLVPMETYRTIRPVDRLPNSPPLIIQDMPHMTQFVHDFYKGKAHDFRREYEHQQQLLAEKEEENLAKEQENLQLSTDIPKTSTQNHPPKINEEYQGDSSDDDDDDDKDKNDDGDKEENDEIKNGDNEVKNGDDDEDKEKQMEVQTEEKDNDEEGEDKMQD